MHFLERLKLLFFVPFYIIKSYNFPENFIEVDQVDIRWYQQIFIFNLL